MAKNLTSTPTSVLVTIEQKVNSDGNVTSVDVARQSFYKDSHLNQTVNQSFDLSVIPYDVALSLACQIVTGFRNSQSK